jgi:hypothetical protein
VTLSDTKEFLHVDEGYDTNKDTADGRGYNSQRYGMMPSLLHQNSASSCPIVSAMKATILSPEDARLVLHRFVTERIPIFAFFISEDGATKCRITGFVTSFTSPKGLLVSSEHPALKPDTTLPATMVFSEESILASTFGYSDDTEIPEASLLGSGLHIALPNGDNLVIAEIREKR